MYFSALLQNLPKQNLTKIIPFYEDVMLYKGSCISAHPYFFFCPLYPSALSWYIQSNPKNVYYLEVSPNLLSATWSLISAFDISAEIVNTRRREGRALSFYCFIILWHFKIQWIVSKMVFPYVVVLTNVKLRNNDLWPFDVQYNHIMQYSLHCKSHTSITYCC